MTRHLLFITRSRLNENNGGSYASRGFIQCFSKIFDNCSIIFPSFEDPNRFIPSKCALFPYDDKRSIIRKGVDVYRGHICADEFFVKKHLSTHSYDLIVIDNSFAGASLTGTIKKTGAKLITIHHNVERDYNRDNAKGYSLLFRYPYLYFANKAERDCLLCSDINLTLTSKDAETFRSWYPEISLHHWGVYDYQPLPDKVFTPKAKEMTFVITGSLYFIQSLLPIIEFINNYWPLVHASHPTAKLIIAGRNPNKKLQDLCNTKEGITIVPNPDDISAVVQQGHYYICPINVGSGLKLRLLDGLKEGLPVLCHDISAAGYENIASSGCLFTYHDKETFTTSLQQILSSKISPNTVYETLKKYFSTEAGVERLKDILEYKKII